MDKLDVIGLPTADCTAEQLKHLGAEGYRLWRVVDDMALFRVQTTISSGKLARDENDLAMLRGRVKMLEDALAMASKKE